MYNARNHNNWTWILFMAFLVLSVIDIRFALLGFMCMILPLYHSIRGRGRVHCTNYCPRGSFLSRSLGRLSMKKSMPSFMKTNGFRNFILILIFSVFGTNVYISGGDISVIATGLFSLVIATTLLAITMGVFYKERSWCTICPMGHSSNLITKAKKK